ncbi:acyl-CoA-binding domain-containing protein 5-like isoform X2 [Panulirus ornatus]|uniref:acyl-CoA-binding domain-containing protein 5-like isoform X2 n=1 Tax=Panulirus ornatus TaxID=150431 RepID=UPI003A87AE63
MTTEEKFQAAVNIIRSLPKDGPYQPSHDMMLKFYGLYKQAVEGPCTEPKPAFYEVVKGYKWRAWNSLGNMTKNEAMNSYVDELKKIIETMAYTENVANFIDALGPFYEFIDIPGKKAKINNHIKDLPDNDSPSNRYEALQGSDSHVTNGHHHVHKMNGNQESDSDAGYDVEQSSSQDSSPQLLSVTGELPFPTGVEKELKETDEEENEEDDNEEEELIVVKERNEKENTTTHTFSLTPKVFSDSDSDEEYSEPAEITKVLPSINAKALTQPVMLSENTPEGAVTCGGGDQSHPGGLQMTPRQSQQGSRYAGAPQPTSLGSLGSLTTPVHAGSFSCTGGGSGSSGGGGGSWGGTNLTEDVNAQLVVVLRRLQTDMESVLHRLNTLETITVSQHHTLCHRCQGDSSTLSNGNGRTEPSWWPFPELSPRSTFFLLVWPLFLHGGLKLLLLLRSRRRQRL